MINETIRAFSLDDLERAKKWDKIELETERYSFVEGLFLEVVNQDNQKLVKMLDWGLDIKLGRKLPRASYFPVEDDGSFGTITSIDSGHSLTNEQEKKRVEEFYLDKLQEAYGSIVGR